MSACVPRESRTRMFTAALFVTAPKSKTVYMSVVEGIHTFRYTHIMECCTGVRMHKLNSTNVEPNTQKGTVFMVPFM